MSTRIPVVLALSLAVGCAGPSTPIPVEGDVQILVGEWTGEYASPQTGRVGSISFTLAAGADTASGDILMVPTNAGPPESLDQRDPNYRPPRLLRVSFVRCEGRQVTGWIDPYPDPDTGEMVRTTFDGTVENGTITGSFTSYVDHAGRRITGTWKVKRKKVGE